MPILDYSCSIESSKPEKLEEKVKPVRRFAGPA
jgi:hypothetical protein